MGRRSSKGSSLEELSEVERYYECLGAPRRRWRLRAFAILVSVASFLADPDFLSTLLEPSKNNATIIRVIVSAAFIGSIAVLSWQEYVDYRWEKLSEICSRIERRFAAPLFVVRYSGVEDARGVVETINAMWRTRLERGEVDEVVRGLIVRGFYPYISSRVRGDFIVEISPELLDSETGREWLTCFQGELTRALQASLVSTGSDSIAVIIDSGLPGVTGFIAGFHMAKTKRGLGFNSPIYVYNEKRGLLEYVLYGDTRPLLEEAKQEYTVKVGVYSISGRAEPVHAPESSAENIGKVKRPLAVLIQLSPGPSSLSASDVKQLQGYGVETLVWVKVEGPKGFLEGVEYLKAALLAYETLRRHVLEKGNQIDYLLLAVPAPAGVVLGQRLAPTDIGYICHYSLNIRRYHCIRMTTSLGQTASPASSCPAT